MLLLCGFMLWKGLQGLHSEAYVVVLMDFEHSSFRGQRDSMILSAQLESLVCGMG